MPRWKQEKVKERRKQNKTIKEMNSDFQSCISELESRISSASSNNNNTPPPNDPPREINPNNNGNCQNDEPSQLSQGGASMFGRNAHRRGVGALTTTNRINRVFDISSLQSPAPSQFEGRIELDSHPDTTCAGPEVKIIDYT